MDEIDIGSAAHAVGEFTGAEGVQAISPFALLSGAREIEEAQHKEGAERAAQTVVGGGEMVSGGLGMAELMTGAEVLPGVGQVLGALGLGWKFGSFLNEHFGLADKLSGPTPSQRMGLVDAQRGSASAADVDQNWVEKEAARLGAARGDQGGLAQLEARQAGAEQSPTIGANLHRRAGALRNAEDEVEKQRQIAEALRQSRENPLLAPMLSAHPELLAKHIAEISAHYAD